MRSIPSLFIATVMGVLSALAVSPALALDCQKDFEGYTSRAQSASAALNASAKRNKGKLDPVAACPRLRNLVAIQSQMIGYMEKNKDWCHIPDDAIAGAKEGRSKTASIAGKACGMAVQIEKIKRQQAQQQAAGGAPGGSGGPPAPPRLPTGPL